MTTPTPHTWASSEYVTASLLNAELRDNITYLLERIQSGWVEADFMGWTQTSTTTFTVSGDYTDLFQAGLKIRRFYGTTPSYFYVISSTYSDPLTTVVVTGGLDYVLTPTSASDWFSFGNPPDFPFTFNWSPTFDGFSSDPASGIYRFSMTGNRANIDIRQPNNGTSDANNLTISLPITAKTITNMQWYGVGLGVDNGSTTQVEGYITSAGTVLNLTKTFSATNFTTSGNKRVSMFTISYEV